jgi:hypothetical protein
MCRRFRQPHKNEQKEECQMNPEFDSEYAPRRNGPVSHLENSNAFPLSILYSLDAALGSGDPPR